MKRLEKNTQKKTLINLTTLPLHMDEEIGTQVVSYIRQARLDF